MTELIVNAVVPTLVTLMLTLAINNSMEKLRFESRRVGRPGRQGLRYYQLCIGHVLSLAALALLPGILDRFESHQAVLLFGSDKVSVPPARLLALLLIFITFALFAGFVLPLRMRTRAAAIRMPFGTRLRAFIGNSLGAAALGCAVFFAFAGRFP